MPYTLIKGTFHIHYPENPRSGPEPDGDTLKFLPDSREHIDNLPRANRPPKFTQTGITTIRFEGIDALETHFSVEGDEFHQDMAWAIAARDALLAQANFGEVQFFEDSPFKVEAVENHPVRGYLLSNGLDTYGRTIAFVYTGEHPEVDGSSIFVTTEMVGSSLNAFMLREGQAYPAFYITLPADLRNYLRAIVVQARGDETGLWAEATATTEVEERANVPGLDELQQFVIWPKLFRRLASFYQDGHTDLAGLDAWLRADPRDRDDRLLMPNRALGNMHDLIVVNDSDVGLRHRPEDIVMVPDDYALPETPVDPGTLLHTGPGFVRIVAALIDPQEQPEYGHETVTLLNTTDAEIDLTNWFVADRNGRQELEGVLAAGEALRVRLGPAVKLSNTLDTITVLDPEEQIIDQVSYEARNLPGEGHTLVL